MGCIVSNKNILQDITQENTSTKSNHKDLVYEDGSTSRKSESNSSHDNSNNSCNNSETKEYNSHDDTRGISVVKRFSKRLSLTLNNTSSNSSIGETVVPIEQIDTSLDCAKLITFFNVDMDVNEKHQIQIDIKSTDIKVLILSCYDPIQWVLNGNIKSIKKIIVAESVHSRRIHQSWYPNNTLPNISCHDDAHDINRLDHIQIVDEYFDYYQYLSDKKQIKQEIDVIKEKYNCQVVSMIRKQCAPLNVTV